MKTVLVILSAFFFASAHAATRGHDAGNGGFTVSCDHALPGGQMYEPLDYHEARTKFPAGKFTIDLGGKGTEWDRVRFALDRLAKLDPSRAAAYQEKADHFEENALHVQHVDLPNADDLGAVFIETGCHTVGTILQFQNPLPGQRKYLISDDVYLHLSEDGKAGMILHEIIYGELMALGATNSMTTRYFNAVISAKQISDMSGGQYQQVLSAVGLQATGSHPMWTQLSIELPPATAGQAYVASLSPFIVNPQGANVQVRLVGAGPSWLRLMPDGNLLGTPTQDEVGNYTFQVMLMNGGDLGGMAMVQMEVRPRASVTWSANPIDLGEFPINRPLTFSLSQYVTDSDGAPLTFSIASGQPYFLSLGANGALSGTPQASNVGAYAFEVEARDSNGYSARTTVKFTVTGQSLPPTNITAKIGQPFLFDLKSTIANPHDGLGWEITGRPAWMTVDLQAVLKGTPSASDVGVSDIYYTVHGQSTVAEGRLHITVVP